MTLRPRQSSACLHDLDGSVVSNLPSRTSISPEFAADRNAFFAAHDRRASDERVRLLSAQLLVQQDAERRRIAQYLHDQLGNGSPRFG
jgi:signal transduction histidine kinase